GEQHSKITELINVVNDIERVGDHSENIAELAQEIIEGNLPFSDIAVVEMNNITNNAIEVFKNAVEYFKDTNFDKARHVVKLEEEIDELEQEYRSNHIKRLNEQTCNIHAGVLFLDLLSNLERVS